MPQLYKSLKNQTNENFEWIIVDDGSTDNTRELIYSLNKSNLNVTYIKQINGGKHRAINRGIKYANGDFTIIVDSDDYLTNDAIETIIKWCNTIEGKLEFAGVSGLKGYSLFKKIGGFPKYIKFIDATNLQRKKYDLGGDKAEVYRTNILRQYPFPTFKSENFIAEGIVWNRIAKDGYKIRWFK
ncbi:hypothetical protein AN639_01215 [Candidatus Epulonipiscium fishelsonii]|uniref:Uncharacterized protein n=1 Tax=Candidatus Epulonipiscium fishelsonii TaxID=77094 RepID=A0ACC8X7R7_9FIRM|nr:hypothetical protein AN396_12025 [Epulopiscium sp. SCG-B11WGA-EpuloA1]ONI40728.1 hypothetical protein AN639_01215 [Epulopiscium sp. SCG-B05WGA-EpuloA1]